MSSMSSIYLPDELLDPIFSFVHDKTLQPSREFAVSAPVMTLVTNDRNADHDLVRE